ncbi:hypothetical protein GQ42DRAFT_172678, partial [Ramicandelaber brevisporus]
EPGGVRQLRDADCGCAERVDGAGVPARRRAVPVQPGAAHRGRRHHGVQHARPHGGGNAVRRGHRHRHPDCAPRAASAPRHRHRRHAAPDQRRQQRRGRPSHPRRVRTGAQARAVDIRAGRHWASRRACAVSRVGHARLQRVPVAQVRPDCHPRRLVNVYLVCITTIHLFFVLMYSISM